MFLFFFMGLGAHGNRGFKMMDTFARVYIFVMVPKWNLTVTKLVTRKEQKSHPMRYIFGISASRRPNIPNFGKS